MEAMTLRKEKEAISCTLTLNKKAIVGQKHVFREPFLVSNFILFFKYSFYNQLKFFYSFFRNHFKPHWN